MANGKPGAPKGNRNGAKTKRWTAALEHCLRENDWEGLKTMARQLIADTADPDPAVRHRAMQMIGDRIEGKPKQQVDVEVVDSTAQQMEEAERRLAEVRMAQGMAAGIAAREAEDDLSYLQ